VQATTAREPGCDRATVGLSWPAMSSKDTRVTGPSRAEACAPVDVAVVGGGPAAWLLAEALATRGRSIAVVAPLEREAAMPVFGAFHDEIVDGPLARFVARTFARPRVAFDADGRGVVRTLARVYARVDGARLIDTIARGLGERVARVGIAARGLDEVAPRSTVRLVDERVVHARAVVDASGHRPVFDDAHGASPTAFQTAFGAVVDGPLDALTDDDMVFMDWRGAPDDGGPPSFVYAMPEGDGRWFVEETALAARPAVTFDLLESRLRARVRRAGRHFVDDGPIERCRIPLDPNVPSPMRAAAPFGASLGIVHPATGYLLAESARLVSTVADAIVRALDDGGATTRSVARAVVDAVWTPERLRAHALLRAGAEIVMAMDHRSVARFFDAFFECDVDVWSPYLIASSSDRAIARAMWAVFVRADLATKARLMGAVTDPALRRALRGLVKDAKGHAPRA